MSRPVAERLAELEALGPVELRARWPEAFGRPAPKHMSRDLLLRALAYGVQEQAEGGLSKTALRHLRDLANPKGNSRQPSKPPATRLRPGTRLLREWHGEVHQVTVLDDGFDYRGDRFASLSRIARAITGTRWSGPAFFGLRKPSPRPVAPSDA